MYIISGLITTGVLIVIDLFWRKIIGQSVLSEYFVVGAYIAGYLIGRITTKTMVKKYRKCTAIGNAICIGMCVYAFFSLSYTEYIQYKYKTSMLNSTAVSSIEDDVTYFSFIKDKLYKEPIKVAIGKRGHHKQIETRGKMNYFIYFLQLIAIIFGGVCANNTFSSKYDYESICIRDYCRNCRRFKIKKNLFNVDTDAIRKISKNGHINVDDSEKFIRFIKDHRRKKADNNVNFSCDIVFCRKCSTGKIVLTKNSLKEKKVIYKNEVELSQQFVEAIDSMS